MIRHLKALTSAGERISSILVDVPSQKRGLTLPFLGLGKTNQFAVPGVLAGAAREDEYFHGPDFITASRGTFRLINHAGCVKLRNNATENSHTSGLFL